MIIDEAIRIIKIVLVVAENFEITVQGEEFTEEKCKEAVDMAIEALEQEPRWIPVSERLPDECDYKSCYEVEDGAVLWTNEEGLVGMGYYYESTKTWSDTEDNPIAVIAWMPLPKPYVPDTNIGKMSEIPTGEEVEE